MKAEKAGLNRALIPTLILGMVVAGFVGLLHFYGILLRPEIAVADFISRHNVIDRLVMGKLQYLLVVLLAFGVTWATIEGARRGWAWWIVALLAVELVVVPWVFALYHTLFQPVPSILTVVLSFAAAYGFHLVTGGSRARFATAIFSSHLSQEQIERLIRSKFDFRLDTNNHEATAVVCDLANKHDLPDNLSVEMIAAMFGRFVTFTTEAFLREGAYIHSADGEGVVAIFGFPVADAAHAEIAAGATLRLLGKFDELRKSESDLFEKTNLHFGLSSGELVGARLQNGPKTGIAALGEPLEMARRLCQVNRTYGSRILLGPQTFVLAEKDTIARPIDFLDDWAEQDRIEIYELLALAKDAKPEEVMRRDSFWNGVVYYREQRWQEAYAEFKKAWGDNGHDDAPLQSYLRRLEPHLLHLTNPA